MAGVKLGIAGDSTSLERAIQKAKASTGSLETAFESAEKKSNKFTNSMDKVGGSVGDAEGRFMGLADLADGLGGAFGLPTEAATGMFRAFGDLSGGFEVVQGLFTSVVTKLGALTGVTAAQTAATGTATAAQWSLNAAISANPIGAIVIGITAAIAAGVLIVKNWDTIKGAFSATWGWIKDRFGDLTNLIGGLPSKIWNLSKGMFDGIKDAFRGALNWVIRSWNSLEFKLPEIGFGPFKTPGFTLGVPDIPQFANGGIVGGPLGHAQLAMVHGGERITPYRGGSNGGGGSTVVNVYVSGTVVSERSLVDAVHEGLLGKQRRGGSLGFAV